MAFPPFPSQDLAKLVLGYLIEEQLMTAYDEFLNESPYLDAQKNEFDRVVMNSLRNILGEYRAAKIYVESCKPVTLRRKLFQCANLLEVVKFLVQYVDVKKLQQDLHREKSLDSQEATSSRIGCDACQSLNLETCACSSRRKSVSRKSLSNSESVEAGRSLAHSTSLSDLPGNQSHEDHSQQTSQSSAINQQEIPSHTTIINRDTNPYPLPNVANVERDSHIPVAQIQPHSNITTSHKTSVCGNPTSLECSQNIAEFNTVLNQVYNNSNVTGSLRDNNNMVCTENTNNNRISMDGNFQDFTTGVRGPPTTNVNIPDSSTTENVSMPTAMNENDQNMQNTRNTKTIQRKKCIFRLGNVKHDVTEICSEVIDVDSVPDIPPKPKPEEQKVTIISNVKVDDRVIPMAKNATSTPLLNMQTIYINGTPIYTPKPIIEKCLFTKAEIMAMPTIILGPVSGTSQRGPTCVQPRTVSAQDSNITTNSQPTTSCAPTLQPLTVDVTNTSNAPCNVPIVHKTHDGNFQENTNQGIVKTVDALKNASVPKDNIVSGASSTSTPHTLPPQRKSSSTPRRTSHVRILDFTTPRRILDDTINENPNEEGECGHPEEIMISKSPNVSFPQGSLVIDDTGHLNKSNTGKINSLIAKTPDVNKSAKKKASKRDWDADLRALVAGSEAVKPAPPPKPKAKQTPVAVKDTAKNKSIVNTAEKARKKSSVKHNVTATNNSNKVTKKKEKLETAHPQQRVPSPTVSPIGIVAPQEKRSAPEIERNKEIKSNDEDRIVTPELERLYLRNEVGAKLNISDMLETPYKQALYEIQMETPRFLGPELPDDPMSDIKITDIPTPRFLTTNTPFTPKPAQATPSSYSSRPTDYSSGGSYYKPDDQDYFRIVDDAPCPEISSQSQDIPKTKAETKSLPTPKETQSKRNRRPVRQCTKNVSYYNSPAIGKNNMESNKKEDSSFSDSASANSSLDNVVKDNAPTPSDRIKQSTKLVSRKSLSLTKQRSPLKKVTQKPFIKVKPRRPTSTDSGRKNNRKSSESTQGSRGRPRIKNTNKDKGSSLVAPAPMKSRRKSSTPRKLHCTKPLTSESSGHDSPDADNKEKSSSEVKHPGVSCVQDSDTEQLPLRWSDDGSQDTKSQGEVNSAREIDDEISKIKAYINNTMASSHKDSEGSLHNDLVKRGFDIETARSIERDLLSTPVHMNLKAITLPTVAEPVSNRILEPISNTISEPISNRVLEPTTNKVLERSMESDSSTLPSSLVINEDEDSDDFEFSVHECNQTTANYFSVEHNESSTQNEKEKQDCIDDSKLRDKFTFEIDMEDYVVRLKAPSLNYLLDHEPLDSSQLNDTIIETELAVSSISNMDRLYTPMKDPIRATYFEVFDSTLTSLDTPLKAVSPDRSQNATVPEIVVDRPDPEEKSNEKAENRKRKRLNCSSTSEESVTDNKKVKPEAQLILQSKDIQNMDIEVLLTKLHGS